MRIAMDRKKVVTGLIVLALVLGGVYWYRSYSIADADPYADVKIAMRVDTTGGATPAETLAMFVAALRANDDARAAKFFMLDDSGGRAQWERYLANVKKEGLLKQMANDIEKYARPTKPAYDGDAGYELLNNDGTVAVVIDMEFNPFSGVWKLQSL